MKYILNLFIFKLILLIFLVAMQPSEVIGQASCTGYTSPTNAATVSVSTTNLTWTSLGGGALGYKVFFGTDPALVTGNINNGTVSMGTTYTTPALTCNTIYYWKIIPYNAGGDATGCVTYSFSVPALVTGTIGSAQSVCYNTAPAGLTSSAPASGGTGGFTYQWQSSPDNITWSNIGSATAITYSPVALTSSTYFRRSVTSGSCVGYTSSVLITVYGNLTAGIAGTSQSICYNTTPVALTETTPASGGTGTYTYQWQSANNVSFTGSTNQVTTVSYSPGALTSTIYYRRRVISGSCGTLYTPTNTITVYANLTAGTIGAPQTICYNTIPAAFASTAAPAGGTGTYTYQWQSSTDNITYNDITGANAIAYTSTTALTANTWYRRMVTSGACTPVYSGVILVTVNADLLAGAAGNVQTICSGTAPAAFVNITSASGGGGSAYQWQSSTDNTTWTDIPPGTGQNYTSGNLSANTYFRRRAVSASCGTVATSPVLVTIYAPLVNGSIGTNQTICANQTPSGLTNTADPTGGTGTYTYQWQSSTDNITFTNISGATSNNYAPGVLAATRYYKRGESSCGGPTYTPVITITVNPLIANNTVASAQSVCNNTSPSTLTATTPTGGYGTYTYQWEKSTTSATLGFAAVSGATTQSLSTGPLTATSWYRMVVTSVLCSSTSTAIAITVNTDITNNTITGVQSLCTGQTPLIPLTGTTPAGSTGAYTYQWESSTTSASSGFAAISGATAINYSPGALGATTWFRRVATSGPCSNTSTSVKVTVFSAAQGTPTVYGDNTWIAYAYFDNNFTTPAGYYIEPSLTFTTSPSQFSTTQSPYYALSYQGCVVPVANYSVSLKRTNFPSDIYQIDVTAQDDNGALLIDGTQVYSAGCCLPVTNIWTGALNAASNVEFRWRQFGSPGNLGLQFTTVTAPTLSAGTISANQSICIGDNPVPFTSSTPATGCSQPLYQWQSSPDNTVWTDISGENLTTYDAPAISTTTYYRRKVTDACNSVAYTSPVTVTVNSTAPTPSQEFGAGTWNIHCYQDNSWSTYGGYYTEPTMNFTSTTRWNSSFSPSSPTVVASGYQGCQVPVDNFSVKCKRTGFTTGIYQIDITSHDDDAYLLINGVQVWVHVGCCDAHTNVWTGNLNSSSTVEFRWKDYSGGCSGGISINPVTPVALTGGTIGSDHSICYGNSPVPFSNVASPSGGCYVSNYQWQQSTDNGTTWGDISGGNSVTFTDTRSIYAPIKYRRKASDICSNVAYSNTVTVTLTTPSSDPNVYGSNTWNVYAYQDSTWGIYAGYFTDPSLSFDSKTKYLTTQPPSYAPGYSGCQMFNTIYSVKYKRQGVPTNGIYQIDIPSHDDDMYLYINGTLVFNHNGCCDVHTNVWTGNLTSTSNIELRYKNGNGPGNLQATFTIVAPGTLVGGTIGADTTICSSDVVTIISTVAASGSCTANYTWESSPDNVTWSAISGATAAAYTTVPNTSRVYYRRKATENCSSTFAYSNTVTVNILSTIPGDPSVFGTNVWNAYAYSDNTFSTYKGYYTENILSFNTNNVWGNGNSPYDATTFALGYKGCQIPDDYFGVIYKRVGFPAGTYQLDVQHDDNGTLFVDGTQVYTNPYTPGTTYAWLGTLSSSSTIEFRMAENSAGANLKLFFTSVTAGSSVTAGTISGTQTICNNTIPAGFTSSSPAVSSCYVYYQWQSSLDNSTWSDIVGARSTTYTSVALTNTTYFRRKSSDGCNNVNYTSAVIVTVNPVVSAGTVTGPASTCYNTAPGTLTNGTTATGGNNTYTYQWQNSTNGTTWSNIGSATASSYVPGALTANTYYRVAVSSCAQTSNTAGYLVTVNPVVSITTQPVSNTACSANPATFSVTAAGTGLTYQWQEKVGAAAFANRANGGVYSGATTSTLTLSSVTGKGTNQYQVIVTGTCGPPTTVTSSAVTLSENTPPIITTQPVASIICQGNNTTFSVVAGGTSISYQWKEKVGAAAFANISNGGIYSGATTNTLTLTNVALAKSGNLYQCVITSPVCAASTTTSNVLLTVNPSIASNTFTYPGSNPVCNGVAVGVMTGSTPTGGGAAGSYSYQWINSTTSATAGFANSGGGSINSSSYPSITTPTWYKRIASKGGCIDTSTFIQITTIPGPSVTTQPVDVTTCPGTAATFSAVASNAVSYQWQEKIGAASFANITDGGVYSGATTATLSISNVTGKGSNQYRVVVTGCGSNTVNSSSPTLYVPTVATNPSNAFVCSGSGATFSIIASGSSSYTYQWQVDQGSGFSNVPNSAPYANVTSATLTVARTATTAYNGYKYRAVLSGCSSSPSAFATFNIYSPIVTNSISQTQNICTSTSPNPFTGSVPTGGDGVYSYQWQVSTDNATFSPISGATSRDYTSGAISSTTYFNRIVTTSGTGCTSTSTPSINVTVNPTTVITTDPVAASVCQGGTVNFSITAGGQGLSYQWQVNTGSGYADIVDGSVYSNTTTSTLTISNTPAGYANYQYRCKVGGNCPSPSYFVYSTGATLTITSNVAVGVSIAANPTSAVCSGTSITLTATPVNPGLSPSYQWKVNGASVGANQNTYSSAGFANGDVVTAVLTSNVSCPLGNPATSNTSTISIIPAGSWTGALSTSWITTGNWCGNAVPTVTSNVTISSGTPIAVIPASGASVRNLTINSGSSVSIASGGSLTLKGNLVNNGTLTDLGGTTIFSGTTGTQTITGVTSLNSVTMNNSSGLTLNNATTISGTLLLSAGNLTSNGNLRINLNTGAIDPNGVGTITGVMKVSRDLTTGWHYLISPLSNTRYSDINDNVPLTDKNFYYYNETNPKPNTNYGWKALYPASLTTLLASQNYSGGPSTLGGYGIKFPSPTYLDLSGLYTHNTNYVNNNLSYTPSGYGLADGWQMVGNPYPSFINWNSSGVTLANVNPGIYFYNSALALNASYIPNQGMGEAYTNGGSPYIAAMQAFWIQTNNSAASIGISNSARVINPNLGAPYNAPSFFRQGTSATGTVRTIKLSAGNSACSDETVVRFGSLASDKFDPNFDIYKFLNGGICSSLYSETDGSNFSINSLPEFLTEKEVNINYETASNDSQTLTVKKMQGFSDGYLVFLKDKLLHTIQEVNAGSTYHFAANTTDVKNRFALKFVSPAITGLDYQSALIQIDITNEENNVYFNIINNKSNKANIVISNLLGQVVYENDKTSIVNGRGTITLSHCPKGIYVAKIVIDGKVQSEKIYIEN